MPLKGRKVLVVLPRTGFRGEEVALLKSNIEAVGAIAVFASPEGGEAVGMAGERLNTIAITEPRSADVAGVILADGAGAAQHLWSNGLVHKALRIFVRDVRPIGAIGLSVVALAKAGLLEGKKATVFVTSETLIALKDGGAHYEKRPIVIDGDIVTADGPASTALFARLFLDLVGQKR